LIVSGGSIEVKGSASASIDIRDLVASDPSRYSLSATHDPEQAVYPYATHACLLSVDDQTGEVEIDRYVIVEDCGRIINPMIVEGQVHGATAQGVGGVLLEGHDYDEFGQLRTASLIDYLVPTASEIPEIELTHLELPSPATPTGVKGVGEGGTIAPAPAIANALGDALGFEFNHFPITPEQIRDAARASRDREAPGPPA
jgi:carbon-monoxide dehydrogenase large subunit